MANGSHTRIRSRGEADVPPAGIGRTQAAPVGRSPLAGTGRILLAGMVAIAALGWIGAPEAGDGWPTGSGNPASPEITWTPSTPVQGHLFVVRVHDVAGREIRSVNGRAAGEPLHFAPDGEGGLESLVPVPIEHEGVLELDLTVAYPGGEVVPLPRAVPVAPGTYEHERLTVAPRYGAPPDSADQARLARDRERARQVSEAAHRTPRIWGEVVVVPRVDRVTSGFGNGREFNGQVLSRHMGLDLDGETGDTIYAATRGVVELVDDFLLAGNIVYLNHGAGLVTGYFHMSAQLVAEGDTVEAGTPIGLVGATGRVTGPHLHWVVRYGHTSVEPRSLLAIAGVPAPS